MLNLLLFSVLPFAALLGSAAYTLVVSYRLRDWRPGLFVGVLVLMAVHQGNELFVFVEAGPGRALSGFGEYPETTANLLASAATVLLLRFVTRERHLAEQLQGLAGTLEERVQERTEELNAFASSVSHDLRVPLRAIDGYTQLLKQHHAHQLDEEAQRLLDVVRENTQKMGTLIDDLLTLARLGRCDMNVQPLDMNALVQNTYEDLGRTAPATDSVDFEVHSLPPAAGDPSMIRQVVLNLLSNAVKFSRNEPTPRVEVTGTQTDAETVFSVRDNGVGVDMNYADKLFGVFERLHDEEEFEGTGVGLAIVDRVLRRHDGRAWAESTKGEGTTVYFSLPHTADTHE
ncbi:sensor histidine kinase [Salinibacter altiplanensis]|uniref:sensor histidine kinase n=1 Tax=Salinibacter altiplanensis TaxID=1803181 RepID=UPI001319CC0B|nr:ATP-binding protein [Salinibacter altiplanensis]